MLKFPTHNGSVLVVDDDEDFRLFVHGFLTCEGISCTTADSVEEARQTLQSKKISLVLLDCVLRGVGNGMDLLAYCKRKFPLLPVIMMSGLPFGWRLEAALMGADACLEKPFDATHLVRSVRQWLNRDGRTPEVFFPGRIEEVLTLVS